MARFSIEKFNTQGIDAYVATGLISHNESQSTLMTSSTTTTTSSKKRTKPRNNTANKKGKPTPYVQSMKQKLQTPEGKRTYGRRKGMVEPVFGWIKSINFDCEF